jgi:hypothetical protein
MRRLRKNRAMSSVTLRMPEGMVEDLKRVAPTLGFEGSVPLLIASLECKGVADSLIQQALAADQAT